MGQRRRQVLDASLQLLGTRGARGLTHPAVDTLAEVPPGTTSNHFRTRDALLRAALARLLELERDDWSQFAREPARSVEEAVDALVSLIDNAVGPSRLHTRARLTLFLEAESNLELAALLRHGRAEVLERGTAWLAPLHLSDPAAVFPRLAAQIDGEILHRLVFPDDVINAEHTLRRLLID